MQQAKDNQGRPWNIHVSAATVIRVAELVKVDREIEVTNADGSTSKKTMSVPLDIGDAGTFSDTLNTLRSKFLILGETLYAVCKPQADAANMTREQFLDGLAGDALESMHVALVEEIIAFFPASYRGMMRLLRAKMDEVGGALIASAEEELSRTNTVAVAGVISGDTARAARACRVSRRGRSTGGEQ